MQTLYLNKGTGDIELDAVNSFKLVTGDEEKIQAIWLLLITNTGEWFLNTKHGLAYEHIQKKGYSEARIRAEVIKALNQEPRIEEIMSLDISLDRASRALTINFVARMDGQEVAGEVVV